jgi:hypothetical protein
MIEYSCGHYYNMRVPESSIRARERDLLIYNGLASKREEVLIESHNAMRPTPSPNAGQCFSINVQPQSRA